MMKVKFLERSLIGDAGAAVSSAREQLRALGIEFEETETGPDVLVFLTGGTEVEARQHVRDGSILLPLGIGNGLAASLEVKAWAEARGMPVSLVADQLRDPRLRNAFARLSSLSGCRIGIIGEPSEWLIKSGDPTALAELGIVTERVLLDEVVALADDDPQLTDRLAGSAGQATIGIESIREAVRLYVGLKRIVGQRRLTGFALRCFDLIAGQGRTACLALSLLNNEGVVAACEGDLEALATMLVATRFTDRPCFMANPALFENGVLTLAHCTVNLSLVESHDLVTHFESGTGVSIRGRLSGDVYTVLRLGRGRKFFVVEAQRVPRPLSDFMCRTQVSLAVGADLLTRALGNHHIVVPGAWEAQLACLASLGWRRV
ncbi:MAG: hypothetical protein HY815_22960 [Candidatus Riflebacteria bacterium]|nr:hypothetical protein [Candidatus Riflebacteria bacterium]